MVQAESNILKYLHKYTLNLYKRVYGIIYTQVV